MTAWKLEDAKNRFSEVVRRAASDGPQFVTKHGREAAVVVGVDEYRRLTQPMDLFDFLSGSPLAEAIEAGELVLDRPRDLGRELIL